ncbi:hypothetical protein AgCh_039512 [Apium graveolens]
MIIKCGFMPNVFTYNIILRGLISQDEVVEAELLFKKLAGFKDIQLDVVREMEANDCLLDSGVYNSLIRGCFYNKKFKEAVVLVDEMRARDFSADASTTSMLVDLLGSEEQDDNLLALRNRFLP